MSNNKITSITIIFTLLIIIIVLLIGYIFNKKIKYHRAVLHKNIKEKNIKIIQKNKYEVFNLIKELIEEVTEWVSNYDQWNSKQSIANYHIEVKKKILNIKNSFNYQNMNFDNDEIEIFKILNKLSIVNPLYWNEKLTKEIECFYNWGIKNNE